MVFQGFPPGKVRFIRIPEMFFSEILPNIDHLGELKVCLYFLWRLERTEGTFRYLMKKDFNEDKLFMQGLGKNPQEAEISLDDALQRCVSHTILLEMEIQLDDQLYSFYFLNSPKGRAAVEAIRKGEWTPSGNPDAPLTLDLLRPNIFRIYEENIGVLTPILADMLREAESIYPLSWIEEAFQIAVANNTRNWRYIEAILRKWKERGRDDRDTWGDTEKDRRRYSEGRIHA